MKAFFEGKALIVDGRRVSMPYPIDKILALSDRVIVLLDFESVPEEDPLHSRNVLAFDQSGELLWRIARSTVKDWDDGDPDWRSPYSGIGFAEDGRTIHVYEWAGVRHDLDPETGQISNGLLTK